ncbi:M14 family metallopeptidase [Salirhabdus sp. Marseille-P4669]|uniref:M14 family metallopeptidase n=1 Tax=Salirhabdus sp. Marseille-P4669 TaxID=2042310 RepID=UPI0011AEDF4F|nr:M14 family metallocarboxypeptidase [Salirhabdus sp. Marseille-P4669]
MSAVNSNVVSADKSINKSANYDGHFRVINDKTIVYDNRGKGLLPIGRLIKGQTYTIVSDYGNWHRIQFGSHYGYVYKHNTVPGYKNDIQNINSTFEISKEKFRADEDVIVYDNTSGDLIPFAELEKGQEHEIVSDYGNWYRILVANRVGYVHKTAVTRLFTNHTQYFEVLQDDLPVYDNSTGKLVKIGTLNKGQVYPRVSDYGNWHRIQFGDSYGYVWEGSTIPSNSRFIKNINSSFENSKEQFLAKENAIVYDNTGKNLVPFATIEKGEKYPIVSDYGNWYRIIVAERVGYIQKTDITGYFSVESKYFEVTKDNLTVYDNRSGSLEKIGELTKGQVYERVSDYGNWHRIDFGNYYGYVHKSGTLPSFKNQIPNLNSNYKDNYGSFVTVTDANVFDNTSGNLVKFAQIVSGKEYPIVSDYGNWYRILVANKVGYIHKSDVNMAFTVDTKYFKVKVQELPIFDNRSGKLVQVGTLKKGQVFERVSDYGNWHRIKFGDYYGYVWELSTEPINSATYRNKIVSNYSNGTLTPTASVNIYDNTGSNLVSFATLEKGKTYPVVRDYGNWYEVNIAGRYGYVAKGKVKAKVMVAKDLVNPHLEYTYENLGTDIIELSKAYPDFIKWEVIGKSVDGRNIYAIKLGKGQTEIFLNGAHHAREWLTTNLLMEMVDTYSQAYVKNSKVDSFDVRSILNQTSIWFVPMVNPDGVTLVQKGASSAKNPQEVIRINGGSLNFSSWKANIRGVDLNRQYPAGWETILFDPGKPSHMNYKGPSPLSEPETKAIYNFTKKHDFKTAVAYHSSGEILYWDYKLSGELKRTARRIAEMIKAKTGYSLVFPGPNPSGGGYTDWFLLEEKKPGFTPEISPHVGPRPVPLKNFISIWSENNSIGIMLAQEAYQNRYNR